MKPVQLLDPDGNLTSDENWPLEVTSELCRDLYRKMRIARSFDEQAYILQRQGELGLWLQSLGQEAAQVGSITSVRPNDHVFPSYREHAAALCRGIPPDELLVQWRGNTHSGWDPHSYRFHIYTLVLAAQLPHAAGYAMGVQRDGADEIVLAYFGDGAASEGEANETFNWAAVTGAPLLLFCQNNQWAISTPAAIQMRTSVHERARGFGLDTYLVDGNDVLAVRAVTSAVAERVRRGGSPALIEALTYRMAGHSTSDDPDRYRDANERDLWQSRDPMHRLERLLDERGWRDDAFSSELDADCDDLATRTREVCQKLPKADINTLFDTVLVERTSLLAEEQRRYADLVASFEE